MTETLSHVAMRRINGTDRSPWYEPMPGVRISLSEEGCLVIDAPAVSPVTLTTNDRAEMHADGRHFRILGRKDNVICSGGIKLQAEQIEEKLRPFISQPLAITKRLDAKLGEAAILAIEGDADEEALRAICREHLTPYEIPRDILFVNQLPLTQTGKIARAELARKAIAT